MAKPVALKMILYFLVSNLLCFFFFFEICEVNMFGHFNNIRYNNFFIVLKVLKHFIRLTPLQIYIRLKYYLPFTIQESGVLQMVVRAWHLKISNQKGKKFNFNKEFQKFNHLMHTF
jgi:hypothetical protein